MNQQSSSVVVQEIYEAFARGDMGAVLDHIDEDAELRFEGPKSLPWAGHWKGRAEWGRFFQTMGENADELALQMEPFATQGENVVYIGRYQARVRATGKPIDSPLAHLWTVRDGRVIACIELTNSAEEVAAFS